MTVTIYTSLSEVIAANAAAGFVWFHPDTLDRMGTVLESDLYAGRWFITSEQAPHGPRGFTVREVRPDSTVQTAEGSEFYAYETFDVARDVLIGLVAAAQKQESVDA